MAEKPDSKAFQMRCPHCAGMGLIAALGPNQSRAKCPDCNGKGTTCSRCNEPPGTCECHGEFDYREEVKRSQR